MEQYILELIRNNNRVIIPNFGAFIIAHEKGMTILFNNFLSFNDGLLVEHVMQKENIDRLDATDKVNHFVERINKTLDTTGHYKLEGLGEFTKDSSGILRFTQADDLNLNSEGDDKPDEPENEELLDLESTQEEEEEKEEVAEEKTEIIAPPVEPPVEEQPEEEKTETVPEPEPAAEPEIQTTTSEDIYKEEKAKEKVALFIILFVLVPLIGFGIYYFFFSDTEATDVKAKQEIVHKPIVTPPVTTDKKKENEIVAGPESTVKETPVVKEEKVNIPVKKKPAVTSRRHYIIVGSFKEEANANKFVETMKSKGFDAPVTIPRNGMYLVGVESFSSLSQAMKRQEQLLNEKKLESWILTVR